LIFLGLILTVPLSVGAHTVGCRVAGFIGVVSAIIGYLIYVFGCVDLLKAKGYDSSVSLAFVIPALCCNLAFILFAPIIILTLKDKTR
jgi:hypothetical protein